MAKLLAVLFLSILTEGLVVFSMNVLAKILIILLFSQKEIIARLLLMFGYSTAVVLLYFSYGRPSFVFILKTKDRCGSNFN